MRTTLTTDTALIFNATLAASSLVAAYELGLLERCATGSPVDIRRFCTEQALHLDTVEEIARVLACFDILTFADERSTVEAGEGFRQAYRDKSYFLWLVGGYGYSLQHLAQLSRIESRASGGQNRSFVMRDARSIAAAGQDCGAHFVDGEFDRFLAPSADDVLCDLGCGSAGRLIALASGHAGLSGTGVEINGTVAELARANIEAAGLTDRLQVVVDDVWSLSSRQEFGRVTVLTSFFMGHDLWPKNRCVSVLATLRRCFPCAKRFLLCDTVNSELTPRADPPIFSLGFELIHALMGQRIPTFDDWMGAFDDSEWECVDHRRVGIPYTTIFDLRPR